MLGDAVAQQKQVEHRDSDTGDSEKDREDG